jgi:hypothetical protein
MAKQTFVVSKPVRIRKYLAELLRISEGFVTALKIQGTLKSYGPDDVREFLNREPVYLQRAIARLHGLVQPKIAIPVTRTRRNRSKLHRA